jgi:hypothetical protein
MKNKNKTGEQGPLWRHYRQRNWGCGALRGAFFIFLKKFLHELLFCIYFF